MDMDMNMDMKMDGLLWCLIIQVQTPLFMNITQPTKQSTSSQSSSSQNSDQQWHNLYTKLRKQTQNSHNQTQSHSQSMYSHTHHTHSHHTHSIHPHQSRYSTQNILKLKQKIAQFQVIVARKDQEIRELNQVIVRMEECSRQKDRDKEELKRIVDRQARTIVQEKAEVANLNQTIKQNIQHLQLHKFDIDLLHRQIAHYQTQISTIPKPQPQPSTQSTLESIQSLQSQLLSQKQQNKNLQSDLKRLKQLLSQTEKYKKFATKIEYKHYLGKGCSAELENWAHGNVVVEVGRMFRKFGIKADRKLEAAVAKVVDRVAQDIAADEVKRVKRQCKSRIKDMQRRNQHSIYTQVSISKHKAPKQKYSRSVTESSIYPSKPHPQNSHICTRILTDLKHKILSQLSQPQPNKKRIKIILEWAIDSIIQLLPHLAAEISTTVEKDYRLDKSLQEKSVSINKTLNATNIF